MTGSLTARPGQSTALLDFARAHVAASLAEPGCLSHAVHRDVDDPGRLFFFERWESREALAAHFVVARERGFTDRIAALAATSDPQMYEAVETRP